MIRYLTLNGEEFPFKFGFAAFMRVKQDMGETEVVVCICYHALKIAAKKIKPSLLQDERLKDLDTFADEIFTYVADNENEMQAIFESIQAAKAQQGEENGKTGNTRAKKKN